LLLTLHFIHAPTTTHISTLSLHDALPILFRGHDSCGRINSARSRPGTEDEEGSSRNSGKTSDSSRARPGYYTSILRRLPGDNAQDRKSTRLNSSHVKISYAVFCLKKKKKK